MRISDWSSYVCSSDLPHAPQSMHTSASMTWSSLRMPVMASTGHFFTQAVQPMQVSMILYAKTGPSSGRQSRLAGSGPYLLDGTTAQIGRASGRERVFQYV